MKCSKCGRNSWATTTHNGAIVPACTCGKTAPPPPKGPPAWAQPPTTPRAHAAITTLADQAIKNANLDRNAAKGDWRALSRRRIFWLFLVEVWELFHALRRLRALRYERGILADALGGDDAVYWRVFDDIDTDIRIARQHVKHEAGDCVAFLAFLVDRV